MINSYLLYFNQQNAVLKIVADIVDAEYDPDWLTAPNKDIEMEKVDSDV